MKNFFMIEWTKEDMAEFEEHLRKRREFLMSSKEAAREYLMKAGILTPDGRLVWWFKKLYGLDKSHDDVRY